jgi:hypothetical protein
MRPLIYVKQGAGHAGMRSAGMIERATGPWPPRKASLSCLRNAQCSWPCHRMGHLDRAGGGPCGRRSQARPGARARGERRSCSSSPRSRTPWRASPRALLRRHPARRGDARRARVAWSAQPARDGAAARESAAAGTLCIGAVVDLADAIAPWRPPSPQRCALTRACGYAFHELRGPPRVRCARGITRAAPVVPASR